MSWRAGERHRVVPVVVVLVSAGLFVAGRRAAAHGGDHEQVAVLDVARGWTFDPLTIAVIAGMAALYAVGVARAWRRAGAGRALAAREVVAFIAALVVLMIALLSPLDGLSDLSFSAHMSQHELLMLVAAPLLVMGRPLLAYLWALPTAARVRVGEIVRRRRVRSTWMFITGPIFVLVVHGIVRWIWHAPVLYEAALADERVHAIQHATFFVSAALFWWSLLLGRYGRKGYPIAVVFVFLTAVHSGLLGALLTFATRVWYPTYAARAPAAGVDALADQQLAGLIMWIPAGVLFLLLGLAVFVAWLGEEARRGAAQREVSP